MPNTTTRFIQGQIRAMAVLLFEVGAYKPAASNTARREPEMLLRSWDIDSLLRSIEWLRFENLRGRNIYIRPKGERANTSA
jgi:hypothetical protein